MHISLRILTFIVHLTLVWGGMVACSQRPETVEERAFDRDEVSIQSGPVTDSHNSRNSLDWNGVYEGTLPCADCEGIQTSITLMHDLTFIRSRVYLGRDDQIFSDQGKFTWDDLGLVITLVAEDGDTQSYQVGENVLFYMDQEGNRIDGDLAEKYRLKKNRTDSRLEMKKWILTELKGQSLDTVNLPQQPFLILSLNRFSGNASCNNIFGSYELKEGDHISFGTVGSTMMACLDMTTEMAFLEILKKVDNYSVADSTLSLTRGRMASLLRFKLLPARE